jgi:hypothetical protein
MPQKKSETKGSISLSKMELRYDAASVCRYDFFSSGNSAAGVISLRSLSIRVKLQLPPGYFPSSCIHNFIYDLTILSYSPTRKDF